jgi:hypothetical protein
MCARRDAKQNNSRSFRTPRGGNPESRANCRDSGFVAIGPRVVRTSLATPRNDSETGFWQEHALPMTDATKRTIARWIHLVLAIPIIGYIYSPFEQIPNYAPMTRFVFVPAMLLSGLWMWKGHLLRRLVSRRSARQAAA